MDAPEHLTPYTVIWWCEPDTDLHVDQVYATDPNDAVYRATRVYVEYTCLEPGDIQLMCVLFGHCDKCFVEADDRFSWFS